MRRPERPNIPRAKRDGLDLDLAAVCAAGPERARADDHYRLKTYGVCPQRQDDRFMVRLRVAGGPARPGRRSAPRRNRACVRGRVGAPHHPAEHRAALGATRRRARAV